MKLQPARRIAALFVVFGLVAIAAPVAAQTTPLPNPPLSGKCGINVALVFDTSGSITSADGPVGPNDPPNASPNPGLMRDAGHLLVNALSGTPSSVGVFSFRTAATEELGFTAINDQPGTDGVNTAIDGINWFPNTGTEVFTNWEEGFQIVDNKGADLVVYMTDGNPTTYVGGPIPAPEADSLERGVLAANAVKADGTRVVAIAIGSSLNLNNIQQISGTTLGSDYFVADFTGLAAVLADLANQLCAPSVTVQNLVDPGTGVFAPQAGWTYSGVSNVVAVPNPADQVTLADGLVNYKLSGPGSIDLTQTTKPGFELVSVTCRLTDGTPLTGTPIVDGITLNLGPTDIAICEFRNVALIPGLAVDKVADIQIAQVGETVTYTYTVTNTGNVIIDNLTLTDDILGPVTLAATTLAPGATTTGTATYVVTAADLAGPITNIATASGTDPNGVPITATDTASVDLAAFTIAKVADITVVEPGDTVTYTYTVTNTGSVKLTNLALTDDKLGPITLAVTELDPGDSTTGTATYVVTAADLAAGVLTNVATGTAEDPNGDPVPGPPATETVDLAGITLDKTVNTTSATVGDTVTYTFVITNVGTVPLTNITLTDNKIGPITLPGTSLAPGASMTATATYVVTAADAASPPLVNVATVAATDPNGDPLTATDSAQVPTLVLQAAATTTTTTTTTTTIAPTTLPKTGGQVEAGPASSLGASIMMLGAMLVLAGISRRRLTPVRQVSPTAVGWARRQLGVPAQISEAARDWARRHLS
jgi:uncharacterized repeat protein (TIGR01451 family)